MGPFLEIAQGLTFFSLCRGLVVIIDRFLSFKKLLQLLFTYIILSCWLLDV